MEGLAPVAPPARLNTTVTTVLVVDDEPIVREVVVSYLRREGFDTLEAGDGDTARELVEQEAPSLVVLGLSAEAVRHMFDPFWRGDRARSRERGGAGLGLAIARGLVEAHGGRIWADSSPGGGARVSFTLPWAA